MIRYFLVLIMLAVAPLSVANSQSRDVYTVRDIAVDESAESVIEAREKAFSYARIVGAREMLARVTLPEDLAKASSLVIDAETAGLLAAAVDVEEETAGAGRYRGSLAVVFNPSNLRTFLEQNSVPFTDTPAPKALIIPVASRGNSYSWNAAWDDESVGHLAPTITSRSAGYSADTSWEDIAGDIALYDAKRGILADLRGSAGSYRVTLSSITPSGIRELGTTPRVATMSSAATAAADFLDTEWKQTSIIREDRRTLIEATVLYTSLAEWNTLRGALARSPLVSDFQTRAISRDGAVVAFLFAGDSQRLTTDLRDRGVVIRADQIGWVMTSAITAGR